MDLKCCRNSENSTRLLDARQCVDWSLLLGIKARYLRFRKNAKQMWQSLLAFANHAQ